MKKLVVIFCVLLISFSICNAQTLNPGLFKVGNKKFKVAKSGLRAFVNDQKITILNVNYKYATVAPPKPKVANPFPMQKKDIHFDILKVNDIVYQILSEKKSRLKSNKEVLSLQFAFNQKGTLENVGYILNSNTLIDLENIQKIDNSLKESIMATFSGTDYLQYEVINYSYPTIVF